MARSRHAFQLAPMPFTGFAEQSSLTKGVRPGDRHRNDSDTTRTAGEGTVDKNFTRRSNGINSDNFVDGTDVTVTSRGSMSQPAPPRTRAGRPETPPPAPPPRTAVSTAGPR